MFAALRSIIMELRTDLNRLSELSVNKFIEGEDRIVITRALEDLNEMLERVSRMERSLTDYAAQSEVNDRSMSTIRDAFFLILGESLESMVDTAIESRMELENESDERIKEMIRDAIERTDISIDYSDISLELSLEP